MMQWIIDAWHRFNEWLRRLWGKAKVPLGIAVTAATITVVSSLGQVEVLPSPPLDPPTCDYVHGLHVSPTVFFAAVRDGYAPPVNTASRHIGTCAEGVCLIDNGCDRPYAYEYITAGPVTVGPNDWHGWKITAPIEVARAWEEAASEHPEVFFLEAHKAVLARLQGGGFQAAKARQLLNDLGVSWDEGGGYICRGGLRFGPGLGGVDVDGNPATCDGSTGTPYPAHNPHGRGWEQRITTTDWADIVNPPEVTP